MASLFIAWVYIDAPQRYFMLLKQFTIALYQYFSIPLLFATLFDPWRHDAKSMTGVPLRYWGEIIINNGISRLIGFSLRSGVLIGGALIVLLLTFASILFIVMWYALPLVLLSSLFYGFVLLGGSYA
jgi:hypothetical protein